MSLLENDSKRDVSQAIESLMNTMARVEKHSLKAQYLYPAQKILRRAQDEDSPQFSPSLSIESQDKMTAMAQLIEQQPKALDKIKALSEQTLYGAQHALYMARAAQALAELTPAKAEQQALVFEQYLKNIYRTISDEPLPHASFQDQVLAIIQAISQYKVTVSHTAHQDMRQSLERQKQRTQQPGAPSP